MSGETKIYFSQLATSIKHSDRQRWEKEIKYAEDRRLDDPSVMDIMAAQQVDLDNLQLPRDMEGTIASSAKWIQLAIDIEEAQFESIRFVFEDN
jgi:hypothetical protein